MLIDGIINEPTVNFVGKDGFFWWVGEVEDNEDPMELGRVKARVLGYYTNVRGGTTADLPTEKLPWATVLQHTSQAGNDGQGESSGQLQPGAIVMGFFMDGENAQMPIVIGVLRVNKAAESQDQKQFAFTGEPMEPGVGINASALHPSFPNSSMATSKEEGFQRQGTNNSVVLPASKTGTTGGAGSPKSIAQEMAGSSANPTKPRQPSKPIPAANGVGGPWKTLEYKLSYLLEDLADTAGSLVKAEDGEFLDMVTGKLVTAKALTAKIQNFLGAVFAQVVSAVRQQLGNLAEQLSLVNLLGGVTGAPYVIFTAVQQAITQILSSLCSIDSQLIGYIQDPIGSIFSVLEGFLEGAIDKAAFVVQGIQATIDSVVCQVQGILDSVLTIVDTVSTIVQGVQQAQEIIEAWKSASGVFEEGTDLIKKGISSITGLMQLFLKFAASGCDRTPDGGVDTVGWFPLLGVTHCTDEELDEIKKIQGQSRGSCGGGSGPGSLIDSILNEAEPYLTTAKNFINGAYEMHVGTPGREATLKKSPNGTTSYSVKLNNSTYAEHVARKKIKETQNDLTPEQIEQQVQQYKKSQNSAKGDTGNLVADHTSYAGNYTEETHGDNCKQIDGDHVVNVDGDYFLKITGDCHIEVGGGFFFGAEGSPKVVDKKGEKKSENVQKHTLRFGSDVDINTVGAKFEVQGAECNIASISTKILGNSFEASAGNTTISAAELILSGDNSIEINTPALYEFINQPVVNPVIKSGIFRAVAGSVETVMIPGMPGGSDAIPRYTIANPAGPYSMTGLSNSVNVSAASTLIAGGLISEDAGGAMTMKAGGAITATAGGVMKLTATSIFLN